MSVWLFFLGVVVLIASALYVPGYLLARSLGTPRTLALGASPICSLMGYGVVALLLSKAGIATSGVLVLLPVLAVAIICCGVTSALRCRRSATSMCGPTRRGSSTNYQRFAARFAPLLYVAVALVVSVIFLAHMDGPGAVMQKIDNVVHLGTIRAFLESGNYDPFGISLYAEQGGEAISPYCSNNGFYPSVWHVLGASVASLTGADIPLVVNALNYTFSFVVYPVSMAVLMMCLFRRSPKVVLWGALACMVMEAFPWGFLVFGPLYPNLAAFAMVPATVALFVVLPDFGTAKRLRWVALALFMLGMINFAWTQPNGVFTCGVLVAPLCIHRFSQLADRIPFARRHQRAWSILLGIVAVLLIAVVWLTLYYTPFINNIATTIWPATASKRQALIDLVTLSLTNVPAQPLVALFLFLGVAYTVLRKRYRWLSAGLLLCAVMYFVSISTNGELDSILTGFWYTDQRRVAAMLALAAVPLIALGVTCLGEALKRGFGALMGEAAEPCAISSVSLCVVIALTGLAFYPNHEIKGIDSVTTAFGHFAQRATDLYDRPDFQDLTAREATFVEKVKKALPEGASVINVPFDGSVYALSTEDVPLYYRTMRGFGGENELPSSALIREHLNELASNGDVQEAVRECGAEYVLLLDQGNTEAQPRRDSKYREKQWVGLESIADETPGFSVVLADDDMRLYKIDDEYLGENA